jgi:TPP-dependent pyruvate/acetoin dehydrogenase alpha subunit
VESGVLDAKTIEAIEREVEEEIVEAVEFARNSPLPDPETVTQHVCSSE